MQHTTFKLLLHLASLGLFEILELPTCDVVSVRFVGTSSRTCLHLTQSHVPGEPEGVGKDRGKGDEGQVQCVNFPNWTDDGGIHLQDSGPHRVPGEDMDGCTKFVYNRALCKTSPKTPDRPSAIRSCCACGGGVPVTFMPGMSVQIQLEQSVEIDADLPIITNHAFLNKSLQQEALKSLKKTAGQSVGPWTYGLVESVAYVYKSRKQTWLPVYHVELQGSGTQRRNFVATASRLRRYTPPAVELRHCTHEEAQRWRIQAAVGLGNVSAEFHKVRIQHVSEGCFLNTGSKHCASQPACLPQTDLTSGAIPVLELGGASGEFPIWNIVRSGCAGGRPTVSLIGGRFSLPIRPDSLQWGVGRGDEVSYNRFTLHCEPNALPDEDSGVGEHIAWLLRLGVERSFTRLERMAPWEILDVDKEADASVVKARFRLLARSLHPDKLRGASQETREAADLIFPWIQQAHEGLSNQQSAPKFRQQAESDQLLFVLSKNVIELAPDELEALLAGPGQNDNFTIVFLYTPQCSMSRLAFSLVDLAAGALRDRPYVKVAAYACSMHGEGRHKAKMKGFMAVSDDPICSRYRMPPTPQIYAMASGNFTMPFGTVYARELHEEILDFSDNVHLALKNRPLVLPLTPESMDSEYFRSGTWVVCFLNGSSDQLRDAAVASITVAAARLKSAGVSLGKVDCQDFLECGYEGVTWTPDIRLYGAGRGRGKGYSLFGEKFIDKRDIDSAVRVMVTTFLITANDTEAATSALEEYDSKRKDGDNGDSCSGGGGSTATGNPRLSRPAAMKSLPSRDVKGGGATYGGGGGSFGGYVAR